MSLVALRELVVLVVELTRGGTFIRPAGADQRRQVRTKSIKSVGLSAGTLIEVPSRMFQSHHAHLCGQGFSLVIKLMTSMFTRRQLPAGNYCFDSFHVRFCQNL